MTTRVSSPSNFSGNQSNNNTPISDFLGNVNNLMSSIRSRNIRPGAEPAQANAVQASFSYTDEYTDDWRVRISMPSTGAFSSSPILAPLRNTNNSLVWPTVPTVLLSQSANYNELTHTHNNYAFPQYESSRVEDIQVSGQFPVQNSEDGKYWIAAVHFLRSVSKMSYGQTSNKGAPPPLMKLNGYGDYVLKNIPVLLTSFTVDLPADVDYIKSEFSTGADVDGFGLSNNGMVPTLSTITCVFKVAYSRNKVNQFSLDSFVNGNLIDQGYL